MLGLYIGAFLGMLSETSMNIALPDLCEAFGITTGTAQWMVVGYMLAIGVVLPCVGFLLKWVKAKPWYWWRSPASSQVRYCPPWRRSSRWYWPDASSKASAPVLCC